MKTLKFDLVKNVGLAYDKTRSTINGRVQSKLINGNQVLGPPMNGWVDTFIDAAITPAMCFLSPNGRLFIAQAPSVGVMAVALYTFDLEGASEPVYVGKINIKLPNQASTTHTLKQFKVIDNGTTGWKIQFSTIGSVLTNGGAFVAWDIALSDFVPVSVPTIGLAISSNAKAVYFMQDPAALGSLNNLTAANGGPLDIANQLLYFHNSVIATHTFCVFDLSIAPTIVTQNTTAPTVIGTPTFTMAGHGYVNGDPVVLIANVPSAFTGSTADSHTVYFVRNATTDTFELSATLAGAIINNTSATSNTTFARGFGVTSSHWADRKTGIITGAIGTLLSNNSENYCVPADGPLAGQVCGFFATSLNLYLYRLSEIQNGVTTLPTMTAVNVLGVGNDVTAISPTFAQYSTDCGLAIYVSNTSTFYAKRWQNSLIDLIFGQVRTSWLENTDPPTVPFGVSAIANIEIRSGWILIASVTAGQRGIMYCELHSDLRINGSAIISKVIETNNANLISVTDLEELFDYTDSLQFAYRTSNDYNDTLFDSESGGWVDIATLEDLSGLQLLKWTQLKITFYVATQFVGTPAQIKEAMLIVDPLSELSDFWVGDGELTTKSGETPAYTTFKRVRVRGEAVPKLYFRAYDNSNMLVAEYNTVDNASLFNYSEDEGASWSPLGVIPDVIGTRLRLGWVTPAGVEVTVSIKES